MPLFEYLCTDCGKTFEVLTFKQDETPCCPNCNTKNVKKMLSAHSSLSGTNKKNFPGSGDTTCCGSTPGHAGCAGLGSCCSH